MSQMNLIEDFIYSDELQDFVHFIDRRFRESNIFDITGMGRQEIKHSRVLGWLLGEDDEFHRKLFQSFMKNILASTQRAIDENQYEISRDVVDQLKRYVYFKEPKFEVEYEKDNIDIVLKDRKNEVFVFFENKVDASEAPSQLAAYRDIAQELISTGDKEEPEFKSCFGVFLTKEAVEPSSESKEGSLNRQFYCVGTYKDFGIALTDVLSQHEIYGWSPEQLMIGNHYLELLKKLNIIEDPDVQDMATKFWSTPEYKSALENLAILQKASKKNQVSNNQRKLLEKLESNSHYQSALSLLEEYKPDMQLELSKYLTDFISGNDHISLLSEKGGKRYIGFIDPRWNESVWTEIGSGDRDEKKPLLYYNFINYPDKLFISISIGPGSDSDKRERLRQCFIKNKQHLTERAVTEKALSPVYHQIYKFDVLKRTDYELDESDINYLKPKIDAMMDEFFSCPGGDFETICEFLNACSID